MAGFFKKVVVLVFVAFFLFLPQAVQVESLSDDIMKQVDEGANKTGSVDAVNPQSIISVVVQILLAVTGVVFLSLLAYGGYDLITARGDEEKAKKALSIIRPAIVGLIIILMAYGITVTISIRLKQAVTAGEEISR